MAFLTRALRPITAVAITCGLLGGCARHSGAPSADARLQALYTHEWQLRVGQLPDDEDSTRPISEHLARVDPATQEMRLKYWQEVLRKLDALPNASL